MLPSTLSRHVLRTVAQSNNVARHYQGGFISITSQNTSTLNSRLFSSFDLFDDVDDEQNDLTCASIVQRPPVIRGPVMEWETTLDDMNVKRDVRVPMETGYAPGYEPKEKPFVHDWGEALTLGDMSAAVPLRPNKKGKFIYRESDMFKADLAVESIQTKDMGWDLVTSDRGKGSANKQRNPNTYQPLHPITDADLNGDMKSLNRALCQNLYLIVKHNEYSADKWTFPQQLCDGKKGNIYECAIESYTRLTNKANPLMADLLSNAPCGHLADKGIGGLPLFFFRAQLARRFINLPKVLDEEVVDYRWITRDEFGEFFDLSLPENRFMREMLPVDMELIVPSAV